MSAAKRKLRMIKMFFLHLSYSIRRDQCDTDNGRKKEGTELRPFVAIIRDMKCNKNDENINYTHIRRFLLSRSFHVFFPIA